MKEIPKPMETIKLRFFIIITEEKRKRTFERSTDDESVIYVYVRRSTKLKEVSNYLFRVEKAELHLPEKGTPNYQSTVVREFFTLSRRARIPLYQGGERLN